MPAEGPITSGASILPPNKGCQMAKYYAYLVKWNDSCSFSGWRSPEAKHEVAPITSIGWMVRKTKKEVTLTTSTCSVSGNVMDALTIPIDVITKMIRLKQSTETD